MSSITRRSLIGAIAATGINSVGLEQAIAQTVVASQTRFGFEHVVGRARSLANTPFDTAPPRLPYGLEKLEYDSWRDIRFKSDHALLADSGGAFRLEMFHPGFLYKRVVKINIVRDGVPSPIQYSPKMFDFGHSILDEPLPIDMGFAGFRLHFPLNHPHVFDEVISFVGASYFRFLGRDQRYGLSARALCVDAGSSTEAFPFFREFWVETPSQRDNHITIHALLDGEAVTGAFRFDLTAGQESLLDVAATLFPRRAGIKFGLAPLTSMFLTGENDHRVKDGFRSKLHDSDGLSLHTGADEWIWRPLSNPAGIRTTSFMDEKPRGFGLLQRDRNFESYQDIDLAYERRPSYFVEPQSDWGAGRVELIELPSPDETNDNIVASWVSSTPAEPGKPFSYAYRITSCLELARLSPNGRAVNTFETSAKALGSSEALKPGSRRFLIDFAGGDLGYFVNDPAQVEAVISAPNGEVLRWSVAANPEIEGLRAMFDVAVRPGQTSDLRAYLRVGERTLTETWTYLWSAPRRDGAARYSSDVTQGAPPSAVFQ